MSKMEYVVEYTVDDILSTNQNDKCDLCKYKNIAVTKCCQKKLCRFHIINNGEHADQEYYSCAQCETTNPIGENGYVVNYITIYCQKHNIMNFCTKCECYICELHSVRECTECNEYTECNECTECTECTECIEWIDVK